jgi:hypothetical protein
MAEGYGFQQAGMFRYSLPLLLPGTGRFVSQAARYRFVRRLFGNVGSERNGWLANQYIFCLVHR